MPLLSNKNNKCLGIDIGANSIKIVELVRKESGVELSNYGMAKISEITGKEINEERQDSFSSSVEEIAETIQVIMKEVGIKTKKSFFALPDFSSFLISFEVPKMKKSEVESAVQYQARQRVPLPLNEVVLDWKLTDLKTKDEEEVLDVFLLAVPKDTVKTYRKIAEEAGLKIGALDSEVMGFAKIFGKEGELSVIVNIKERSTSVNIINNEKPLQSSSLNISADDFKSNVASLAEIDFNQKNKKKKEVKKSNQKIKNSLANELVKKVEEVYMDHATNRKKIDKILITGKGAEMKAVQDVFINPETDGEMANPFEGMRYPDILEKIISDIGPKFSVATGMAYLGLDS